MNLEFYRNLHLQEFQLKENLSQRFNLIATVLIALVGAFSFFLLNDWVKTGVYDLVFSIALFSAFVTYSFSIFWLMYSSLVPPLINIQRPEKWLSYWKQLLSIYSDGKGRCDSAEEEFTNHLIELYADIGGKNIDSNTMRGERLVKAFRYMLATVLLVLVTFVIFYYTHSGSNTINTTNKEVDILASSFVLRCQAVNIEGGGEEYPIGPGSRPVPNPSPNPTPRD